MWLHAPYSQLEHRSQRNHWVWLDRTAKSQTVLNWYHSKEANLWLGTSPWWAHWQLFICRLVLGLPGAAADLAASRRCEIYDPHQLVYFSAHRSGIPRCVQRQCALLPHHFGPTPDGHLRLLARDVISIPKTLGHCTAFQLGLNTWELCFTDPHILKDMFTFCNCNDAGHAFSWTIIIISGGSSGSIVLPCCWLSCVFDIINGV